MIFAIALLDRNIIDAGDAKPHQAMLVEFPVLITVAAEPITAVVVPLIGEAHGDAVLAKRPDLLDQAVVEFAAPLAGQERFDGLPAVQEFRAVSPATVGRIGERNAGGVAGIPCIFRHARLLRGGLRGEGRKWRGGRGSVLSPRWCV